MQSLGFINSSALLDVCTIAQIFGISLSESFLANGTLTKTLKMVGSTNSTMLPNIDTKKLAEGLGIGLVDGIQQSIESAAGIGSVLACY